MNFKTKKCYTLSTTDYIEKAFKHIPFNAFIPKGRCGIGGTTKETDDKTRNTFIVVPTKGVIEGKTIIQRNDTPEEIERKKSIFAITKDTKKEEILCFLLLNEVGKKAMVIPDNFMKLIDVATENNLLEKLYQDYFLLIDEAHAAVTEDYRDSITIPFDYFWEFDNKSIISATPFYFSDPRFKELDLHLIRFNNPEKEETYIDDITIIEAKNPYSTLHKIIATTEGNLHIFLNSVTEMNQIIEQGKLNSCHVYCNGKEKNLVKLGDNVTCFKPMPINGEYAKVNFYTTRYFEGWDLKDDNATLVLLTNIHQAHTKVGISNKGVQALGRIRTIGHKLIHITNHRDIKIMKSFSQIQKEYLLRATLQVQKYNEILNDYKLAGIEPTQEEKQLINNYADIDINTHEATLKYIKVDQIINRQICDEQFNDISFIKEVWEEAGFCVTHSKSSLTVNSLDSTNKQRLSKAAKFEQLLAKLQCLEKERNEFMFNNVDEQLKALKEEYPFEVQAYEVLGYDLIKEDKFNSKRVEQKLILAKNNKEETKLLMLIDNEFQSGYRYPKSDIKLKLQTLYDKLGITRVATAEQLAETGRCDIQECKIKAKSGKLTNGFLVLRKQFELKTVA